VALSDDEPKEDRFFDEFGRLKSIPIKHKKRIAVLQIIAGSLTPGAIYSERDINEVILNYHEDTAAIRRHMIEFKILTHNRMCNYWVVS